MAVKNSCFLSVLSVVVSAISSIFCTSTLIFLWLSSDGMLMTLDRLNYWTAFMNKFSLSTICISFLNVSEHSFTNASSVCPFSYRYWIACSRASVSNFVYLLSFSIVEWSVSSTCYLFSMRIFTFRDNDSSFSASTIPCASILLWQSWSMFWR